MIDGWEKANVVAEIATAFATSAAAFLSLYLARTQNRAKAKVSNAIVNLVTPGTSHEVEGPFFRIAVANAGPQDNTINSLGWQVGRVRKAYFVQLGPRNNMSAKLPMTLAPSEVATFLFPWAEYEHSILGLVTAGGRGWYGRWRIRHARIGIYLSTGQAIYAQVDPDVATRFIHALAGSATLH